MNGVVLKMFIQSESVGPDPTSESTFQLGVVCRGENNKDWAAATPGGNATFRDPVLTEVWRARRAGERAAAEVLVYVTPSPEGAWSMGSCNFAYNGCTTVFDRTTRVGSDYFGGKLSMTVNATEATKTLRQAYAEGLLAGTPPRFDIRIVDSPTD